MSNEIKAIGKIGRKGELYPPKEIREAVKLKPGDKVLYIAKQNKIEVIPLKTFKEALEDKPLVKISINEFEELTEEITNKFV